jgi:hypothetical protein
MTTGDAEEILAPAPARRSTFPLGLCVGTVLVTGLGLVLAAGNASWAGEEEALSEAWGYVNVALGAVWLVVWPAAALGVSTAGPRRPRRGSVVTELLAVLMAAAPAVGVAAAVAWPGWQTIRQAVALQGAVALLAMGVLTWRARRIGGLLATLLMAMALGLPVAGYVAAEFYPAARDSWRAFIPLAAIYRAANGGATETFRWVVGMFATIGGAMWAAGPGEDDQR